MLEGLSAVLDAVIGTTAEDVFTVAWLALQGAYPELEFAAAIAYLENEWLRHKEKFVHAWTDHHLHFGHRATLAIEPPQRRKGLMR